MAVLAVAGAALLGACSAAGDPSADGPVDDPVTYPSPVPAIRVATHASAPAGTVALPWRTTEVTRDRVYLAVDDTVACNPAPFYTLRTSPTAITIGVSATPPPAGTVCSALRSEPIGRLYVEIVGGVDGRVIRHAR